jgi:hypothetical protein
MHVGWSPMGEQFGCGRVNAHSVVAALAHCPLNRLRHRAESGRSPISDPASELRRVKPRRRDEKRVLDTVWSTGIPGPGTIGIFDCCYQFPVLATVMKTDRQNKSFKIERYKLKTDKWPSFPL